LMANHHHRAKCDQYIDPTQNPRQKIHRSSGSSNALRQTSL
jgi:hypothetical protein